MLQVKESTFATLVLGYFYTEPHAVLGSVELVLGNRRLAEVLQRAEKRALGAHPNHERFIPTDELPYLRLDLLVAQVPLALRHRVFATNVQGPSTTKALTRRHSRHPRWTEELTKIICSWVRFASHPILLPLSRT